MTSPRGRVNFHERSTTNWRPPSHRRSASKRRIPHLRSPVRSCLESAVPRRWTSCSTCSTTGLTSFPPHRLTRTRTHSAPLLSPGPLCRRGPRARIRGVSDQQPPTALDATPYLKALVNIRDRRPTRLMVPGHKGGRAIPAALVEALGMDGAAALMGLDVPLHVMG